MTCWTLRREHFVGMGIKCKRKPLHKSFKNSKRARYHTQKINEGLCLDPKLYITVFSSYFFKLGMNGDLIVYGKHFIRCQQSQKQESTLFLQGFSHHELCFNHKMGYLSVFKLFYGQERTGTRWGQTDTRFGFNDPKNMGIHIFLNASFTKLIFSCFLGQ